MISLNHNVLPQILNNHISVQGAALYSGYSLQYIRRLLRSGKLEGTKIGQLWLIDKDTLDAYLQLTKNAKDQRFGPK
jgi:excisionase family DNA binding protein